MTDLHALIHRMADELDHYRQLLTDNRTERHALATEARAALAQPEPEGPTDEEIMGLMPQQMHEDLATAARAMAEQTGTDSTRVKGAMRVILNRHVVDLARAVLARWGTPNLAETRRSLGEPAECPACEGKPAPSNTPCAVCGKEGPTQQPADGEVAELVAWLRQDGALLGVRPGVQMRMLQAADLLERPSPSQPIPVSERLPGPGDCDDEGRCWWFDDDDDKWCLDTPYMGVRLLCWTHWLPAHALPVPGEVVE